MIAAKDVRTYFIVLVSVFFIAVTGIGFLSLFGSPLKLLFPWAFGQIDLRENLPAQTLVAPFATGDLLALAENSIVEDTQVQPDFSALTEKDIKLDQPHRTLPAVARWAEDIVTRTLNTNPQNFSTHFETLAPYYNPFGLQQVREFYQNQGIAQKITGQNLVLAAFVLDAPTLVLEGVAGGSYKWVFDVSLGVSFYPQGLMDYRGQNIARSNIVIRVQIGRTGKSESEGLALERWGLRSGKL